MRKLALALLYTATAALANPALADTGAAEAQRDGDMKKLNFHSEAKPAGTAAFQERRGDPALHPSRPLAGDRARLS